MDVSRIRRGQHPRPRQREWPVVRAPRVCPGGVSAQAKAQGDCPRPPGWALFVACHLLHVHAEERLRLTSEVAPARALDPAIWAPSGNEWTDFATRCVPAQNPRRRSAIADPDGENATEEIGEKARLRGQLRARVVARSHHGLPGEGPRTWLRRIQGLPCELLVRFPFLIPVSDIELGVSPAPVARHRCPQSRLANGFTARRTADLKWVITIRPTGANRVRDCGRPPRPSERTQRSGRAGAGDTCPYVSGGA